MKKTTTLLFLFFTCFIFGQVTIDNTLNPFQLATQKLGGAGVTITNVTFNGVPINNGSPVYDQAAFFENGLSANIGIDEGVILATGDALVAEITGANPQIGSASSPSSTAQNGDADLAMLISQTIQNAAVLEFDFVPSSSSVEFEYVFASEEYTTFDCSSWNDVFGFFISGPGISGPFSNNAENIATIPGTSLPVSINNINGDTCSSYPMYYVDNSSPNGVQYNGMTTVLTAQSDVQCGQTYHFKLAIANVGDNNYDSAVFLKANSLESLQVDLGSDQLFCSDTVSSYTMTANTNLSTAGLGTLTYNWYLDGVLQGSTTTNQYTATQEGTWSVEIVGYCTTDDVVIQFDAPPVVNPPSPLVGCEPFDLTALIPGLVAPEAPADYVVYFYLNLSDAFSNPTNYITDPANFSPGVDTTVYIRVEHAGNPSCFDVFNSVFVDVDCASPCSLDLDTNFGLDTQTICLGDAIDDIVFNVGGDATDATIVSGSLPAGVTGVYNSGVYTISGTPTGTGSFTATVSTVGCASDLTHDVTINILPLVQATFNAIPAQCAGGSNPLPATSLEGFTGTWSPAFDANNSGSYVFTPDTSVAGQECALPSNTVAVTITSAAQATFNAIPAQCPGDSNPLPSTSLEGFTGTWSPAFDANNSGNYVFTPDTSVAGQECALPSNALAVTITPNVQATFNAIPAQCPGGSNPLPATSLEGFTGSWSPAFDANNSGNYIFTPDTSVTGQECALPSNTVAVTITPNVQATFNAIPAQCAGGANPLPSISLEGWSGSWSPAFDANNSGSYVFTPDTSVAGQECALPSNPIAVTITPTTQSTFNAIPAQCAGGSNPLPANSLEGFTGTWSPAFDANNSGSYVFTPDTSVAGQECALPSNTVAVTITPNVQATFNAIPAQCAGGSNPLPATSLEGFTGSWSPAFDANNSGSYVFTPDTSVAGQECALPSDPVAVIISPDAEITLQSDITNTNQQVCQEEGITNIEYILSNGVTDVNITGLPAGISYTVVGDLVTISGSSTDPVGVYNYTVTTIGGCSFDQETGSVEITIGVEPTFDSFGSVCEGGSFSFPTVSLEGITGSWSPAFDNTQTTSYTFTPDPNQCAVSPSPIPVVINPLPELSASFSPVCSGNITDIVLSSPNASMSDVTYTWSVTVTNVDATSYTQSGDDTVDFNQVVNLDNPDLVGSLNFAVVPTMNGCQGPTLYFTVPVTPTPSLDSTDIQENSLTICSGESIQLGLYGSPSGSNLMYSWNVIATDVVITGATSGVTDEFIDVIASLPTGQITSGSLYFEITPYTVDDNGNVLCTGSTVQSSVFTVNPNPSNVIGSAPVPICSGETAEVLDITLETPIVAGSTVEWIVYDLEGVSGAQSGSSSTVPFEIPDVLETTEDEAGYVTYAVWSIAGDCTSEPTYFTINVHPNPTPELVDGAICVDENNVTFQTYILDAGDYGSDYSYQWYMVDSSQPSGYVLVGGDSSTYEVSEVGTYYVEVTNDITTCSGISNEATVVATQPATSFTTTVTDAFSDNATITVNVSGGPGMVLYQIDGGGFQESNIFTGVSAGEHEITVIDSQGCTFLQETVLVIDYPKFFTPNGDGYNDTWNIVGLNQPEAKLYIFDRYGKLIKELSTVGQGWDGTFNGEQLPSTDYWFSLQYFENGVSKEFKAHFALKR